MSYICLFILSFISFNIAYNKHLNSVNVNSVKCVDCKYFIDKKQGLCSAFGKRNLDGSSFFEYSEHCRKNEDLCGVNGYLYEDKPGLFNNNMNYPRNSILFLILVYCLHRR